MNNLNGEESCILSLLSKLSELRGDLEATETKCERQAEEMEKVAYVVGGNRSLKLDSIIQAVSDLRDTQKRFIQAEGDLRHLQ